MQRTSTAFLQAVVVMIGMGAFAFLLWEPHIEGRNVGASLFEIYFNDPFLAYCYFASISFFVALYHAFRVLGYARQNNVFTHATVKALRIIKLCSISMVGFVVIGELFFMMPYSDDPPAGIFMGVLVMFPSIVIATATGIFERVLRHAVAIKNENELTV